MIAHALRTLIGPSARLTEVARIRKSRLLAIVLLTMIVVFAGVDSVYLATVSGYSPPWFGYVLLLGAFALNRSGRYDPAAVVTLAMFPLVVFSSVISGHSAEPTVTLNYLLLGVVLAGILVSIRGTIFMAAIEIAGLLIVPVLAPRAVPGYSAIVGPLSLIVVGSLLIVLSLTLHDQIESDRRAELKASEERLAHAQRMDIIGRLAGSVAHDFNNLLTVILGSATLAEVELADHPKSAGLMSPILEAANRAAALTRKLLVLARQGVSRPEVLEVGAVIGALAPIAQRLVGEQVKVVTDVAPDAGGVRVDPTEFEQTLINLVVNAGHAMPHGGTLTISAARAPAPAGAPAAGAAPSVRELVRVEVADTGAGMDESVRRRAFEPFFTTRPAGQGTGLGLSTCQSVIRGAGGEMEIESAPGRGTCVRILLPRFSTEASAAAPAGTTAGSRGGETILLVEDDELVRAVAMSALSARGYRVIEADSPLRAIELESREGGAVDLLLTDVVMPEMSGPELARRLVQCRSGLRVLFATGYANEVTLRHGLQADDVAILRKPYTPAALAARVREVLDATRSPVAGDGPSL